VLPRVVVAPLPPLFGAQAALPPRAEPRQAPPLGQPQQQADPLQQLQLHSVHSQVQLSLLQAELLQPPLPQAMARAMPRLPPRAAVR